MQALGLGVMVAIVIFVWFLFNTVKILKQYERGVIFTLGKVAQEGGVKGPGIIILYPGIQRWWLPRRSQAIALSQASESTGSSLGR